MKQFVLNIGNITIIPGVAPEYFSRVNAFNVYVECHIPHRGTDKKLMQRVCQILTEYVHGEVQIRTEYVVSFASFEQEMRISKILFQVITPLEAMWY